MTGCHVIYNAILYLQPRHKVHKGTEFGDDLLSCIVQCIIVFLLLSMIEFDNELMLCVFFNGLKCFHLYHNIHKCIKLRNKLLSCVFQCILVFSNNSQSSQGY